MLVVLAFVSKSELLGTVNCHREATDVIGEARFFGSHEIGEGNIGTSILLVDLLAQHRETSQLFIGVGIGPENDVVAFGVGGPEAPNGAGLQGFTLDDLVENLLR